MSRICAGLSGAFLCLPGKFWKNQKKGNAKITQKPCRNYGETAMYVTFLTRARQHFARSEKAGRPVFEVSDFCSLRGEGE